MPKALFIIHHHLDTMQSDAVLEHILALESCNYAIHIIFSGTGCNLLKEDHSRKTWSVLGFYEIHALSLHQEVIDGFETLDDIAFRQCLSTAREVYLW